MPDDLLHQLSVLGQVSADGVEFSGAEMIYNYERVLRQVTYSNKKPAYYLNRQFRITCSELNGRFVSNEYMQTLTVIHPKLPSSPSSAAAAGEEEKTKIDVQVQPRTSHLKIGVHGVEQPSFSFGKPKSHDKGYFDPGNSEQSNITAMIVVVCVGLMIAFLVLGIIRLRAVHNRQAKEELQAEVEMAWDDSALNITVNPIDDAESSCRKVPMVAEVADMHDSFGDSSDEEEEEDIMVDLYHDEDEEDVEEDYDEEIPRHVHGPGPRARLEWDNNI